MTIKKLWKDLKLHQLYEQSQKTHETLFPELCERKQERKIHHSVHQPLQKHILHLPFRSAPCKSWVIHWSPPFPQNFRMEEKNWVRSKGEACVPQCHLIFWASIVLNYFTNTTDHFLLHLVFHASAEGPVRHWQDLFGQHPTAPPQNWDVYLVRTNSIMVKCSKQLRCSGLISQRWAAVKLWNKW